MISSFYKLFVLRFLKRLRLQDQTPTFPGLHPHNRQAFCCGPGSGQTGPMGTPTSAPGRKPAETGSLGGSARERAGFPLPILTHPEETTPGTGGSYWLSQVPQEDGAPPRTARWEELEPPLEAHLPERGQPCPRPHRRWKPAAANAWRHGEGCALLLS